MKNETLENNGFPAMFERLKRNIGALRNSSAEKRIIRLEKLKNVIEKNEERICKAVYDDFKKTPAETVLTEIYPVLSEIRLAIRKLRKWMKPVKVAAPVTFFGSQNFVRYESKGVVLIISPWNYPFQLAVGPLVSAIAAGNAVVVKPSEISSATATLIKDLLENVFPPEELVVINGGAKETQRLLDLPFNHVYFTGSPAVGKIIMARAAENLASVTLELGGKSPAIVSADYNIEKAAEKIIWGKLINAGQTCIAPDYVIVHESKVERFIESARKSVEKLYGEIDKLKTNDDYCRIINAAHFNRLKFLYDDAVEKGAKVKFGGEFGDENFVAPTVLTNVSFEMKIMREEIFGPLMPVLTYSNQNEIFEIAEKNPHPLALYVFGSDKKFINEILNGVQSGGAAINDTVVHFANYNLPFGGTGTSGTGNAHGFYGFKTFSHERAVMRQAPFSPLKMMYPPYTEKVKKLIALTKKYF